MENSSQQALRGDIMECVIAGCCEPISYAGTALRQFASGACGAEGVSTGTATLEPGARLACHKHNSSEAATILEGEALFSVQGRSYRMLPYDCIHVPAGIPHEVLNPSNHNQLVAHWATATSAPSQEPANDEFAKQDRSFGLPVSEDPEYVIRFANAPAYELARGTRFYDLFAGRFGSVGICGGYGEFSAESSLPCHTHEYDESITIVTGEAVCEVAGRRYRLKGCDTAFVPRGRPHRFLNESSHPMAMVWVYAGSEPERTLVDVGYCTGALIWNAVERH